jgi:hypothetical protein
MFIPAKICDRALFRNFKGRNIENLPANAVFNPGSRGRNDPSLTTLNPIAVFVNGIKRPKTVNDC